MGKMGVQTSKVQPKYMIKATMGCLQDTKNKAILHKVRVSRKTFLKEWRMLAQSWEMRDFQQEANDKGLSWPKKNSMIKGMEKWKIYYLEIQSTRVGLNLSVQGKEGVKEETGKKLKRQIRAAQGGRYTTS